MSSTPDYDREYRLIEQLELRIATADTDEKFESIIQKFLPALVLKLGTENERNRNLTIKVCQHVNQRVKLNQSIQLPVPGLLKTFKESLNAFVRRFSLLFLQLAFRRIGPSTSLDLLPGVMQFSVPQSTESDLTSRKMWSIAFDFLLDALRAWKAPERASEEDMGLSAKFALNSEQSNILAGELCRYLLYDPKSATPNEASDEDFKVIYQKQFRQRSEVAPQIARFIFSSIFTDDQRLIPATIMSVDPNATVSIISDTMFKQCNFDLESTSLVEALFGLYEAARPKLKTKVLTLLSRSEVSTSQTQRIYSMIEAQLNVYDGGLEASKLRSSLFAYLHWVVRISKNIEDINQKTQTLLKGYIESQGWPSMRDRTSTEVELRSKAYESIGLLAGKKSKMEPEFDLIVWLFTSLRCDTSAEVRHSIDEALAMVMNFSPIQDPANSEKLGAFFLWNVMAETGDEDTIYYFATVNSTKYAATRFANKCLSFQDPVARLIDVIAISTSGRRELSEEGARGLDPYWHESNLKLTSVTGKPVSVTLPDLSSLVAILFDESMQTKLRNVSSPTYNVAAVMFCRNVLVTEALSTQKEAITDFTEWSNRIGAMIESDQHIRTLLKAYMQRMDQAAADNLLRRAGLGLMGGSLECADVATELISLSNNARLTSNGLLLQQAQAAINLSSVQSRAARCFGIIASLLPPPEDPVEQQLKQCEDWSTAIGSDAIKVRGHLLAASYTLCRSVLRGSNILTSGHASQLAALLKDIILTTHDLSLMNASFQCISQLALYLDPTSSIELGSDEMMEKLVSESKKENELAITALTLILGYQTPRWEREKTSEAVDRIFKLHEVKSAEFHFALGEAMSVAVAGFRSSSPLAELDIDAPSPTWGYHEELTASVVDKMLEGCSNTKPALRKASSIWLLCSMQYCGDLLPIKSRLRECQGAFARLLTDRDEIVQETGSRGLSIVYERGDKALRDDLVRDLVQSFTGSTAKMSGTVNEDTQLFEAGALPTEGGQSVTTYKDIVSLATEMGDPSLVYRFMNLASNNAIWTSRAAFGRFGLGNILADSSYLAENKKFYPKLFRYRFDPNPNVQRSMEDIWRALVKDPNAVVDQNFDLIMNDLLQSVVSGREWRARQASCAAIIDLVQGRELAKFEKYLDQIWNVAFKVLDDVKESVRVAAMKLCRTLTNMLIRNLEVGQGTTERATTMLNHAMPFLLKQMEGGAAKDVQKYATISLLDVVKKSPPRSLQPFAPMVLETLINSLSSLESSDINYLHLNADKYGLTTEKLDKMRVSSIKASPVTEAIDRCLESITTRNVSETNGDVNMDGMGGPTDALQDAMRRLEGTFKTGIGLPSKVALSRAIVTLVVRHHAAFRPYADKFVQLNRKSILDRNATISIAFSTSLGYLMRLASEKEVHATAKYAQKLYFDPQELSQRVVAGEILQAISKTSNDVFLNYASSFLPFAFIGRNDTDREVRDRFDPPWKDNIGGSRAVHLYLKEISALISIHIKSPLWPIKHACCLAVSAIVESSDAQTRYTEPEARLIWPLVDESLGGKAWDGKERVVSAFPQFVRNAQVLWTDTKVSTQMQKIASRESKRTNQVYRPYAIDALGAFAEVRQDLDVSEDALDYFSTLVMELTNEDAMDVDDPKGIDAKYQASTLESTLKSIASCTFQVLSTNAKSDVLEHALAITKKAYAQHSAKIDVALFEALTRFFSRLKEGSRRGANQSDKENGSNKALVAFSSEIILALFTSHDFSRGQGSSELERKSRVTFVLVLAESEVCSSASLATLVSVLDTWLQTERSRPLRDQIQKATDTIKRIS